MAKSLEDLIRGVDRAGQMNHLSIGWSPSYKKWQISYRTQTSTGYAIVHHTDAVEGIIEVLSQPRFAVQKLGQRPSENKTAPIKRRNLLG